jgi:hypothetical protein
METIKLKFIGIQGRGYKSLDHVTKNQISVMPGDSVELSKEKADQLLKDFPTAWAVMDEAAEEPAEPAPVDSAAFTGQIGSVESDVPAVVDEPIQQEDASEEEPAPEPKPAPKPKPAAPAKKNKKKKKGR